MLRIERVLGSAVEPGLSDDLRRLEDRGMVDIVNLPVTDLPRRRLFVTTRCGEELAVALPPDQKLFDGAVLLLNDDRAIVVRTETERLLCLEPRSIADALELGYHARDQGWRVHFAGEVLFVAMERPATDYTDQLRDLIMPRRVGVSVVDADILMDMEPGGSALSERKRSSATSRLDRD